jgi:hypothetical protein
MPKMKIINHTTRKRKKNVLGNSLGMMIKKRRKRGSHRSLQPKPLLNRLRKSACL